MRLHCPSPVYLVALAQGEPGALESVAKHARRCPDCGRELRRLREAVTAARVGAIAATERSTPCLDDDALALLAESGRPFAHADAVEHVAGCASCSRRLATVTRLLNQADVAHELRRLDARVRAPGRLPRGLALTAMAAGTLAAAVLALVFLPPRTASGPAPPGSTDLLYREPAITTTSAPSIVAPVGLVASADSMRWTRVPGADRYHVKVFDREGTLVLDQQTRDTVLAISPELLEADGRTYLWVVEARTGWDRWVASEWSDFTIEATGRRR